MGELEVTVCTVCMYACITKDYSREHVMKPLIPFLFNYVKWIMISLKMTPA